MVTEILYHSEYIAAISSIINSCENELIIFSPWFSLEGHIKEEIELAIKREVNITVITRESNSNKHKDSIKFLESKGVSIIYDNLLHAKLILADRREAIIGSANLQETGLLKNHELVIYSDDIDLVNQIVGYVSDLQEKLDVSILEKSDNLFATSLSKLLNKFKKQHTTSNELKCPNCGGELVIKESKFGKFYGCSNYPRCKYTRDIKETR